MILNFLKRRFFLFRREAVMLWYAVRDRRTPLYLKVASVLTGIYLISPIDLVPFPVPFLGLVDDLILVPLAVGFIAKRLPAGVQDSAGAKADHWMARWLRRPLLAALVALAVLVVIWGVLLYLFYRYISG